MSWYYRCEANQRVECCNADSAEYLYYEEQDECTAWCQLGGHECSEGCQCPLEATRCGTRVVLDDCLPIPASKPVAATILRFTPHCRMTSWQTLHPQGKRSIAAFGLVVVDVEYIAASPERPVHFAHFVLPFHTIFGCENRVLDVRCAIEHSSHRLTSPRTISSAISLEISGIVH